MIAHPRASTPGCVPDDQGAPAYFGCDAPASGASRGRSSSSWPGSSSPWPAEASTPGRSPPRGRPPARASPAGWRSSATRSSFRLWMLACAATSGAPGRPAARGHPELHRGLAPPVGVPPWRWAGRRRGPASRPPRSRWGSRSPRARAVHSGTRALGAAVPARAAGRLRGRPPSPTRSFPLFPWARLRRARGAPRARLVRRARPGEPGGACCSPRIGRPRSAPLMPAGAVAPRPPRGPRPIPRYDFWHTSPAYFARQGRRRPPRHGPRPCLLDRIPGPSPLRQLGHAPASSSTGCTSRSSTASTRRRGSRDGSTLRAGHGRSWRCSPWPCSRCRSCAPTRAAAGSRERARPLAKA